MEIPVEVDWVLTRALGPARNSGVEGLGITEAGLSAGVSRLLPIAISRTPSDLLEIELSDESRRELAGLVPRAVASELLQKRVCQELSEVVSGMGVPLLFLKGAALWLGGYARPGARPAGDIDILVPSRSAWDVNRQLEARGYGPLGSPEKEQHLPTLLHPEGHAIEIHTILKGVRLTGPAFATLEDCAREGLTIPVQGWPQGTSIPNRSLLTAHLLAHVLSHHGFSPEVYPLVQLLPDLQCLDFAQSAGERFLKESASWIENDVQREEIVAVRQLIQAFEQGEPASTIVQGSSTAAVMLRHFLAGDYDTDYRQSLKLDGLFRQPSTERGLQKAAGNVASALFLTQQQIDAIYGRPKSTWGYVGWLLWRPLDLVWRTVKTRRAKRRLRSRDTPQR